MVHAAPCASDARFDIPLEPSQPRSFVWARGDIFGVNEGDNRNSGDNNPTTNPTAVDLIKYHGTTEDVGYGVLKNLTLDERSDGCADDTIIAAAGSEDHVHARLQGVGRSSTHISQLSLNLVRAFLIPPG